MGAPPYETYFADEGYMCVTWRNIIVNICRRQLTLEALAAGRTAGAELEKEHGPNLGVLTIIPSDMPMPEDAVRRQAGVDMEATKHRVKASATVIRGSGFRASAFRTAYATLTLFSRSAAPSKVFERAEDAARFVADAMGLGLGADQELVAVIQACEQDFTGGPAT